MIVLLSMKNKHLQTALASVQGVLLLLGLSIQVFGAGHGAGTPLLMFILAPYFLLAAGPGGTSPEMVQLVLLVAVSLIGFILSCLRYEIIRRVGLLIGILVPLILFRHVVHLIEVEWCSTAWLGMPTVLSALVAAVISTSRGYLMPKRRWLAHAGVVSGHK